MSDRVNTARSRPCRVVFCWSEVSGYMAACWRALAQKPGIDLHVVCVESLTGVKRGFDIGAVMRGLSHEVISAQASPEDVAGRVVARAPDVVVLCGWFYRPYVKLAFDRRLANVPLMLGMDSPWLGTWQQRFARFRVGAFVKRMSLVVTAGERSAVLARRAGVPERRLRTGFYGCDMTGFAEAALTRPRPWPRRFLFAGRYAPEKGLDTLVAAYADYRQSVPEPWPLTCHGSGPEQALLNGQPGITVGGFLQPADLAVALAEHGAFVLPSRFEPWGVVVAEAASSGLPVVCSSACGVAVDIVRPYYNGIVVPPSQPEALASALRWIHTHEDALDEIGRRGQALAAAFSAEAWADRWHEYFFEALDGPPPS